MTAGAQQFVTPMTFQALSGRPVRTDLWDPAAEAAMGHIELARWPHADRHRTGLGGFHRAPRARAGRRPARDTVSRDGCADHGRARDESADVGQRRDAGERRDAAPARHRDARPGRRRPGLRRNRPWPHARAARDRRSASVAAPQPVTGPLRGRKVVVTAGPTRERIDPVRFITNRSSGKMGFAVAEAARNAGAARRHRQRSGQRADTLAACERINVETAEQMLEAVQAEIARHRRLHRCGRGLRLPRAGSRRARRSRRRATQISSAADAHAGYPRHGCGRHAASVRRRVCRRDAERRAQCARQARRQEARHDRGQPGRARDSPSTVTTTR